MGGACTRSDATDDTTQPRLTVGQNYQEIEGQFAGEGVKRTKAWQSTITKEQLDAARSEFWRTRRVGRRHVWATIKSAVEADAATAALLLNMQEITIENNCMSVCTDNTGQRYDIPIFIINDPVKFVIPGQKKKKAPSPPKNESVTIKIRAMPLQKETKLQFETGKRVVELKQAFLASDNAVGDMTTLKLYFAGRELKDDDALNTYCVKNDMVVQALVRAA
mmetsp:Transcript_21575/g.39464  ORF Transcript_21575/g.39464 Transcript_21575/m.39464 type:complete len:221 (-) Transcript_21575:39-701(-)